MVLIVQYEIISLIINNTYNRRHELKWFGTVCSYYCRLCTINFIRIFVRLMFRIVLTPQ